jgi:hypothetical protein
MIGEFEFFHGAVLARMLHTAQQALSIRPYSESDNAAYVINENKGIYIKYSAKRLSPWRFTFQRRHHQVIAEMKRSISEVFIVLVCNDDGAVVLSFDEFQQVAKSGEEPAEWLSATRNRRQMYLVKGPEGRLAFKVGKDDYSTKLFGLKPLAEATETVAAKACPPGRA